MGVRRPPAAPGYLASTEVAIADPLREGPSPLRERFPRLEEVPRHPDEAPPVVEEPPFGGPHRAEGGLERQRDPDGYPGAQLARRTHLRLVVLLELRLERDAGQLSRPRDPRLDLAVREPREVADLLVGEPAVAGGPQRRHLPDPLLDRGALLHRARREPEPLRAVVLERREPGDVPETTAPDHVRGVAQQAIPGAALRRELPQRAVDLEGRRHLVEADGARAGHRDGRRAREERPAIGLQLELGLPPLEPIALQAKGAAGPATAVVPGLEGVLRQVLLRHGLEPLRPLRAGHELAGDGERPVDRRAGLRQSRTRKRVHASSSSSPDRAARTAFSSARTVSARARSTHSASASPIATGNTVWALRGRTAPARTAARRTGRERSSRESRAIACAVRSSTSRISRA